MPEKNLTQDAAEPAAQVPAKPAPKRGGKAKSADMPEADAPMVKVTCHVAAGRRRAGRRWAPGLTELPAGDLSAEEVAALQGDPMFEVALPAD